MLVGSRFEPRVASSLVDVPTPLRAGPQGFPLRESLLRFLAILGVLLALSLIVVLSASSATPNPGGELALSIRGARESYVATLSGGPTHYIGYRESLRGEGVRFRRVPTGDYLLRIEMSDGGVIARTVVVAPEGEKPTQSKLELRIEDAVYPKDWRGGEHVISAKRLALPRKTEAALLDAWKHIEEGDTSGARAHLRHAATVSPECVDAWTNLGLVAQWDQSLEEAERFYREAFRLDPEGFATNLNLSEVLELMGKQEEAIVLGERALAIRTKDLGANLHLGILLAHAHQFAKAIPPLSSAKQIHPESLGMAQILLGVAYVECGKREMGLAELEEWLARNPNNASRELVQETCREIAATLAPSPPS